MTTLMIDEISDLEMLEHFMIVLGNRPVEARNFVAQLRKRECMVCGRETFFTDVCLVCKKEQYHVGNSESQAV